MQKAQTQEILSVDFSLSSQQLADFNAYGFIGPFSLFTPEEMKVHYRKLRLQLFDRRHAVYVEADPASTIYNYDRHLDLDFLADAVCRPEIVGRIISVLGPDILCWRSEFFPKYPGQDGHSWRQAFNFGGLSDRPHLRWPKEYIGGSLTAWIALTDVDEETGCIQFMPGSHRTMFFDDRKLMHYDPTRTNINVINGIRRGYFGYNWREIQVDPNWQPEESKGVAVALRAGQFVIAWSNTMHASLPHPGNTNQVQLMVTARYVPTCFKIYSDMKETNTLTESGASASLEQYGAVLVSGSDEYKHNRIRTHTTKGRPFTNVNPR